MSNKFFTAGEFAKLCHVKKDTIFYYDKIGLLRPDFIKENGYRYYSPRKFFMFEIISALKEVGTPLKEIKEYTKNRNPELLVHLLKEKQLLLKEELVRIENANRLIENTIDITNSAKDIKINTIYVEQVEEEYYIVQKAKGDNLGEKGYVSSYGKLINYCNENHLGENVAIGEIVLEESIEKGVFCEDYYTVKTKEKIQSNKIFIKPKGLYGIIYIKGSYDDLGRSYKYLYDNLKKMGYSKFGNLYQEDILNYLSMPNDDEYLMKVSINIK